MVQLTGTPARYFPVEPRPLRMRPRLQPFGTDFGNGDADRRVLQRDSLEPSYLRAKCTPARPGAAVPRERYRIAHGAAEDAAHGAVLEWIERLVASERPDLRLDAAASPSARYAAFSDAVQEDFVVVQRDAQAQDCAIAVYVCFPSGWRPEAILGWSFRQIHESVPDFADTDEQARSLVSAMVERGPYVRFVWTICADESLDHHPVEGTRLHFQPAGQHGWLRIERQVSVPFVAESASLFVIRTYLRPFSSLSPSERETLGRALACMPESTARYKGLTGTLQHAITTLQASGP